MEGPCSSRKYFKNPRFFFFDRTQQVSGIPSSSTRGGGGGGGGTSARTSGSNLRIIVLVVTIALFLVVMPLVIWTTKTTNIGIQYKHTSILQLPFSPTTTGGTTCSDVRSDQQPTSSSNWGSVGFEPNYTSRLVSRWACSDQSKTANISIPGLDRNPDGEVIELVAGEIHKFDMWALDEAGRGRCLGGDYFEIDLSSDSWKSRPPLEDHGDGHYTLHLQVHPDFAGTYNLTITLLFRSFDAFKFPPEPFIFHKDMRKLTIRFHHKHRNSRPLAPPKLCRPKDFTKSAWSGRWTRHDRNDSCEISLTDGRFRCLDFNHSCHEPWCYGPVGSLESNGWVYSAHCSFKIYTQDEGWDCLKGKWLFFSGDSNHVDTIRNLLNFGLGLWDVKFVVRRFDRWFVNPKDESEVLRVTSVFNGHWNETLDYLGLETFQNEWFRDHMRRYFSEDTSPDVVIFNSGLHDGVRGFTLPEYIRAADHATDFWNDLFRQLKDRGKKPPVMFYRSTIAVGGYARDLAFNPHKMEVYNAVMVEMLRNKGLLTDGGGVVDDFDMTFAWHYNNRYADGVHYGRPPTTMKWMDGGIGHQYFVDVMLVHVLLNAICNV